MKPSSKFERMKLKPSQAMAPKPSMPTGTNDPAVGGMPAKPRPMANPKVNARREAMRKAAQKMGPMK